MGFKWRSPSPKQTVGLVQSSQAMAGRAAVGRTVGSFSHIWSELLVQERKGLLHSEPFWLFWSSVTVQQSLFALCTTWMLTQGCRTSLPPEEQSQQELCEARSPLHPPQTAPATSHSTTLSWSTLGHLQLLLQHRGCHPVFWTVADPVCVGPMRAEPVGL